MGDVVVLTRTSELSRARRAVADAALAVLGDERTGDVELCVSELVTNAIEHGDGNGAVVTHRIDDDAFVVSVSNGAPALPKQLLGTVPSHQPAGRGLNIVRSLADGLEISGDRGEVTVSCHFAR